MTKFCQSGIIFKKYVGVAGLLCMGFLSDSQEVEFKFDFTELSRKSQRSAASSALSPPYCPTFLRIVSGNVNATILCHLNKHGTASSLLTRI